MVRHRLDSLSDFARQRYNLRITCQSDTCGYVVEASSGAMMRELGPTRARFSIGRLEEKMKCSRCGHRGAAIAPCEPTI